MQPEIDSSFFTRKKLPLIMQTESAECGLACLAMISTYFGNKVDLIGLRRQFSVSLKGATLDGVNRFARELGLRTRAVEAPLESVDALQLPCILHWNLNHFVVLKSVNAKSVTIHDPANGIRRLSIAELSKHFTGIACEVWPGAEFTIQDTRQKFSLLSLLGRIVGLKRGLLQLLFLGIAMQVCLLLAPLFLQVVVDEVLFTSDRNLLMVVGVGFLSLTVINSLTSLVRSWISTTLATSLNFQWIGNVFWHLLRLPLPFFEKRSMGDIVSRFGSVHSIQTIISDQTVEALIDGLMVIATLILMFTYSIQLTLLSFLVVALYIFIRLIAFSALRERSLAQIAHYAKQESHFLESIRGMQSIRIFDKGEERHAAWMSLLAEQSNAQLKVVRMSLGYRTANSLLFGLERIVVVWIGALLVMDAALSVGMLMAFLSYKDQFAARIVSLIDKAFDWRMMRLHGERVADIVLTEPEPLQSVSQPSANLQEVAVQTIEFRDVCFAYAAAEAPILQHFNLIIKPGDFVAITGASGCGKTTLIKLMLGLLDVTGGAILYGNRELGSANAADFRRICGVVMQDDCLFAGSIAENIAFSVEARDDEWMQKCARIASIHDDICAMPMQYNTLVGDIGLGISGGQRQRLLLARALYKRPKILIMDEGTSHLDVDNEHAVNRALQELDITRIVIAHRPETVAMAHRVVRLDGGVVVEDSTAKVLHVVGAT